MTENCPYCGARAKPIASGRDYVWRVSPQVFRIAACESCGFRFTANPPENLAEYYTSRHYSRSEPLDAFEQAIAAETYKLDILKEHVASGSLLEIGPSKGAFAALAKRNGFDVSTIEMDADCVAFVNNVLGIRSIQSGEAASVMRAEGRRYDAIALWHALEHMARPWEIVEAAAQALAPGGVLIIAVPNPDSIQAKWMSGRWPHYDLPRHLSHITTGWLTEIARRYGLAGLSITFNDPGSRSITRQSIPLLLLGLTGASADKGGISRLVASLCWRLGRLAALIMSPIEETGSRGAAYTAVFRKPKP